MALLSFFLLMNSCGSGAGKFEGVFSDCHFLWYESAPRYSGKLSLRISYAIMKF